MMRASFRNRPQKLAIALIAAALALAFAVSLALPSQAGATCPTAPVKEFKTPGLAAEKYKVPAGVNHICIEVLGGGGGRSNGGRGGLVEGIFPVTPGEELQVFVGGKGGDPGETGGAGGIGGGGGGAPAGGGGGGASAVFTETTLFAVAGGGGGGGTGGTGGSGGPSGTNGGGTYPGRGAPAGGAGAQSYAATSGGGGGAGAGGGGSSGDRGYNGAPGGEIGKGGGVVTNAGLPGGDAGTGTGLGGEKGGTAAEGGAGGGKGGNGGKGATGGGGGGFTTNAGLKVFGGGGGGGTSEGRPGTGAGGAGYGGGSGGGAYNSAGGGGSNYLSPQAAQSINGTSSVNADGVVRISIPKGIAKFEPGEKDFGSKAINSGPTAQETIVLKNVGSETVEVKEVKLTESPHASEFVKDLSGCPAGKKLEPNQTCNVKVAFEAKAAGVESGTLTAVTTANTTYISLKGTGTGPGARFEPTEKDFGQQLVGAAPVSQEVTLKNVGDAKLTITKFELTQSPSSDEFTIDDSNCTGSEEGQANKELDPNKTCKVKVTFDAKIAGIQTGTLKAVTNGGQVTVALKAQGIEPKAQITPTSYNYPDTDITFVAQSKRFTIKNAGTAKLTLEKIELTETRKGDFTVQPNECRDGEGLKQLQPGQQCDIMVFFFPKTVGTSSATVRLLSDGGAPTASLTGKGTVAVGQLTPASYDFNNVEVGKTAGPVTFKMKNVGDARLDVEKVALVETPGKNEFSVDSSACNEARLEPGQECAIKVNFAPTAAGVESATLTVHNFDVDDVSASIRGTGIQPKAELTPTTHDFGPVSLLGGSAKKAFTLKNVGTAPMTISSVEKTESPGSNAFVADPAACKPGGTFKQLKPGESCTVEVTFTPQAAGQQQGSLIVKTTGGNVSASLKGEGSGPHARLAPSSAEFGEVLVGTEAATPKEFKLKNLGSQKLTIQKVELEDGGTEAFDLDESNCMGSEGGGANKELAPGAECTLSVSFEAVEPGPLSATLRVETDGGNVAAALDGVGVEPEAQLTPNEGEFGPQLVGGEPESRSFKLKNVGTAPLKIEAAVVKQGLNQEFSVDKSACPEGKVLQPGEECAFQVSFEAKTAGLESGTFVVDTDGGEVSASIDGVGTAPQATLEPTSHKFTPPLAVGSGPGDPATFTLKNTGTAALHIGPVEVSESPTGGEFVKDDSACTEGEANGELEPGESCAITVEFDPKARGVEFGTLTVETDGGAVSSTLEAEAVEAEPHLTPTGVPFGEVAKGEASETKAVTLKNIGSAKLTIGSVLLGGADAADFKKDDADCTGSAELAPGAECTIEVTYEPKAESGDYSAADLEVETSEGKVTSRLTGETKAPLLTGNPQEIPFGPKAIGSNPTVQEVTLTNDGPEATIEKVELLGSNPGDFEIKTGEGTCAETLPEAGECTIKVAFAPLTVGPKVAVLAIKSSGGNPIVPLSGTGTQPQPVLTPEGHDFKSRQLGEPPSEPVTFTLKNEGEAKLTVNGVEAKGSSAFDLDAEGCLGKSLNHNQTCTVEVSFEPTVTGPVTGAVLIDTNGGKVSAWLKGEGIEAEAKLTPLSSDFEEVLVGSGPTPEREFEIENIGTAPLKIDELEMLGAEAFTITDQSECMGSEPGEFGGELKTGEKCHLKVVFEPEVAGRFNATINVEGNGGYASSSLTGVGIAGEPTLQPQAEDFGEWLVGSEEAPTAHAFKFENVGSAPLTIQTIELAGSAAFTIVDKSECEADGGGELEVGPGVSCEIKAAFEASTVGEATATLTISTTEGQVSSVLTGTGVEPEAALKPETKDFGSVAVGAGATAPETFKVENVGTAPLTVGTIELQGSAAFAIADMAACEGEAEAELELKPGESCNVEVTFDPTGPGLASASLEAETSAGKVVTSLTGTGIQADAELNPESEDFGKVLVGSESEEPVSFKVENVGTAPLTVNTAKVEGSNAFEIANLADCQEGESETGRELEPAESCEIEVAFAPTGPGEEQGTLTVLTTAGNVTSSLRGTGIAPEPTLTPEAEEFGPRLVGSGPSDAVEFTLENGGSAPLKLEDFGIEGSDEEAFEIVGETCEGEPEGELGPGEKCTVEVTFEPQSAGLATALLVADTAAGEVTATLTGTGTAPQPELTPSSGEFGELIVGSGPSAQQKFSLENVGTAPLTVSSVELEGSAEFEISTQGCAAATVLVPGGKCQVEIVFEPSEEGPAGATLVAKTDAGDVSAALSGTGTVPDSELDPGAHDFGLQPIDGTPTSTQFTLRSVGSAPLGVASISIRGDNAAEFKLDRSACAETLAPAEKEGDSCPITITFEPQEPVGAKSAELVVKATDGESTATLTGEAGRPSAVLTPPSEEFAATEVGKGEGPKTLTLQNIGEVPMAVNSIDLIGEGAADFALDQSACAGKQLAAAGQPGDSCELQLAFKPTEVGVRTATVAVGSDGGDVETTLTGIGTSGTGLELTPDGESFGNPTVGSSQSAPFTVRNTGGTMLEVEQLNITGPGAGEYRVDPGQCAGHGFGADEGVLVQGEKCQLTVIFEPKSLGPKVANLDVQAVDPLEKTTTREASAELTGEGTPAKRDELPPPSGAGTGAPSPSPSGCAGPSCRFELERVKLNKRKGVAQVALEVPAPGTLALKKNKLVKGQVRKVSKPGTVSLKVKLTKKGKHRLHRKGKVKVRLVLVFTPQSGPPQQVVKKVVIKKKKKGGRK